MSADSRKARALLKLGLLVLATGSCCALAADEPLPDAAFLEYLGSWEGSDEDWLLFEEAARDESDDTERSDPGPEGEESPESEHER